MNESKFKGPYNQTGGLVLRLVSQLSQSVNYSQGGYKDTAVTEVPVPCSFAPHSSLSTFTTAALKACSVHAEVIKER